jgi:hypothetical protein
MQLGHVFTLINRPINKPLLVVTSVVFSLAILLGSAPAFAQGKDRKSNGTLEIVALYVPDFVVFKPAKGKEIKEVVVYLVDETKSFQANKVSAVSVKIEVSKDGSLKSTFTDATEIRAMNFNIPSSPPLFNTKKIKFVADTREMYYNLEKSEWE